ncbi:MAG: type II secretion system protein [Nitrospirae bacterium]|jgi:general secretion pathway protein I|nr:type II secretion system protein [Nitrospirota bacterium]
MLWLRNYCCQEKGFTLLEVLISLAIISGLLVTLIYTVNYHLGIVEKQETVTIGTMLAKKILSEMESNPENKKGVFEKPYEQYSFETIVQDSPYPGISEFIVTIRSGREEIKLNEYILK